MRTRVALLCLTLLAAMALPAVAATPTVFMDGRNREWSPVVDSGVHAWAVDSKKHPHEYIVKVDQGGVVHKVNRRGTSGSPGSIELGGSLGNVLVYWVKGRSGDGFARVKFYDLDSHSSYGPPSGVNVPKQSTSSPSISGDHLFFDRGPYRGWKAWLQDKAVLYRFSTDSFITVADVGKWEWVNAGRVNGDYAVYTVSDANASNVYRYQISSSTTLQIPLDANKSNYWPTVMADGTVYYVRGNPTKCGRGATIMKRDPGGTISTVASMPNAYEVAALYGYDDGSSTTIYYTRITCSTDRVGSYQVQGV